MDYTFSDVGVSPSFLLMPKGEANYTVVFSEDGEETDAFDGRVYLDRSENGGLSWEQLNAVIADGYILNTGKQSLYRFRCIYSEAEELEEAPALEGTAALSVSEATETVREFVNDRGETVAKVTESGIDANTLTQGGIQVATISGTQTLTKKTLTSPTITSAIASISELTVAKTINVAVKVTDAETYTILATNSGKLHIIPDLTAHCVLSLPTAASGLYYRFIYGGVAADAQDWIFDTGSDTNFFLGGVTGIDPDDGDVLPIYPDGNSNSIMKIDTPAAGTSVEFYCDGTNWYLNGIVVSATDTHTAFNDQSVE